MNDRRRRDVLSSMERRDRWLVTILMYAGVTVWDQLRCRECYG